MDIFGIKRVRDEYAYLFALVVGLCKILHSSLDDETVKRINETIEQKREELR